MKTERKDYNYQKARRKMAENGQLRDNKSTEERKVLEEDIESLIDKEDGYDYEIDEKRAGVVHKKNDYWNRTELQKLADIYPEKEEYNYQIAKKQLKLNDD